MHLNSFPGFNGFQNKSADRTSRLFSRTIMVKEGYRKFSQKGISLLPPPAESLGCSPALPQPSMLTWNWSSSKQLFSMAPPEPQPGPADITSLHFLPARLVLLQPLLLLLAATKLLDWHVALVTDTISMVTQTSHCWACTDAWVLHVGDPASKFAVEREERIYGESTLVLKYLSLDVTLVICVHILLTRNQSQSPTYLQKNLENVIFLFFLGKQK